tara:strand:+ start:2304 stop:2774 length:471 start_codon:yes stop_codon:yes gene_type:complete
MIYLKNSFIVLLTFFLIFAEVTVNTFLSMSNYLEFLPLLCYIFYVSFYFFRRSSVLVIIFSGSYFDLFFSENFLGYTSIKLLVICMLIHFLHTRLPGGVVVESLLFFLATLLYKFEVLLPSFNTSFIYLFVICLPNYFLFKILTSTLRRDVLSTKI